MDEPLDAHAGLPVYVTGHSLGGALASLAALDIAAAHPRRRLLVYTFGAPMVGDRRFAAQFRAACPRAFRVVNEMDPVPKMPYTFLGFYEHGPKEVVIDGLGNMILDPSHIERKLGRGLSSVKSHPVMNYRRSLEALCDQHRMDFARYGRFWRDAVDEPGSPF